MGVEFASSNLAISFEEIAADDICVIDVNRGSSPLFFTARDKNGNQIEKFYVRSGNSSQPITKPSEITKYISSRF